MLQLKSALCFWLLSCCNLSGTKEQSPVDRWNLLLFWEMLICTEDCREANQNEQQFRPLWQEKPWFHYDKFWARRPWLCKLLQSILWYGSRWWQMQKVCTDGHVMPLPRCSTYGQLHFQIDMVRKKQVNPLMTNNTTVVHDETIAMRVKQIPASSTALYTWTCNHTEEEGGHRMHLKLVKPAPCISERKKKKKSINP